MVVDEIETDTIGKLDTMGKRMRTCVIGAGKVGHFHARALSRLPNSEFVAVYNHNLEKARRFGADYDVAAFDSIDEMLAKTKPEVAFICTPHPVHADSAVRLAEQGLHLAVEKPLASSLEDCDRMIAAVNRAGVQGTTISQRRYFEPCRRIKAAINAGKLGKPILGTVNMLGWRDMDYYNSDPWRGTWSGEGGGVLVNQAVHQLDLLLWYMGEVESICGMWDTLNHPGLEVDDTAVAVLRFKSGALGNIVVSNSQNPPLFGQVRVHGSNGATAGVQTDGGQMFIAGVSGISEPPLNDLWTVAGEANLLEKWQAEDEALFRSTDFTAHFHELQIGEYLDALLRSEQPAVSLEDGRQAVELFTSIYRSQREEAVIRL